MVHKQANSGKFLNRPKTNGKNLRNVIKKTLRKLSVIDKPNGIISRCVFSGQVASLYRYQRNQFVTKLTTHVFPRNFSFSIKTYRDYRIR